MKQNPYEQQDGGIVARLRDLPRPLGLGLLAVPVVAAAGAFGVPAIASAAGSGGGSPVPAGPAGNVVKPGEAAPSPSEAGTDAQRAAAFRAAGYDQDDAVLLARMWGEGISADQAKLRAGGKLVAGGQLPVKPGQTAQTVDADVALAAFFAGGNDYDDALRLAKLWKFKAVGGDLGAVKTVGGRNLLAGVALETAPRDGAGLPSAAGTAEAFARAGYDRDDAVLLARMWGEGMTPDDATVRAGQKLLAGSDLPVKPGQTAQTVSEEVAQAAFFAAGNGYDDAVRLAAAWNRGKSGDDLSAVKATAGRKILAGEKLPG